jgi:hypothetical protein
VDPHDAVARLTNALKGRYTVEREIGRGGMAIVYRARDERHQRWVALKVLKPELQADFSTTRFLTEIRITANLQHPNLVPLFDSGEADGVPYYVMPLVEGESLRARLHREGRFPVSDAVRIAATVADALDYAHRRGVIHRDLKPENILLEEGRPVVADFGIALAVSIAGGRRLTQGGALGTPQYMSPEQARGEENLTPSSDVYSLALVLYELLAGELPRGGAGVVGRLTDERPVSLRSMRNAVPAAVDAAVMKALATQPADRFSSAASFGSALLSTSPGSASLSARRSWVPALLGAMVIVAGASAAFARRRAPVATTPDIVRLTTSGDASDPSLSPDGQRLAYTTVECDQGGKCSANLVVKDVRGAGIATLVRGLYAIGGTEWSHDGRFVLVNTTTADGKWGAFVVPALGGELRFLGCCQGQFVPGTDTVLLNAHRPGVDSVARIHRVLVGDGSTIDTLFIRKPESPLYAEPFVNGQLLVYSWHPSTRRALVSVVDRHGRILDSLALPQNRRASAQAWPKGNAILMTIRRDDGIGAFVVAHRVAAGGRIAQRPDTLLQQLDVPRFEPTASGGLVYSSGTTSFELLALERNNERTNQFKEFRVASSTGRLRGSIDPTGLTIAIYRELTPGSRLWQLSIRAFEGGPERNLAPPIELAGWAWEPTGKSILVLVARGADSTEVRRIQINNGQSTTLHIARQLGWVWAPASGGYWVLNVNADTMWMRDVPGRADTLVTRPTPWMTWHTGSPSPDGRHIAFTTWDQGQDSLLLLRMSLDDGRVKRLTTFSGQVNAPTTWLSDGTVIAQIQEAGTNALYRVNADGSGSTRLGLLPRKGATVSISADGRRAALLAIATQRDIYLVSNFDKLQRQR